MPMHQGDQYSILVSINKGGDPLTPAEVEGVKVRIGAEERRYPDGTLTYSADEQAWLFPVTQADTLAMMGMQRAQVQVNFGGTPAQIIGSAIEQVNIDNSVIRSEWDE